MEAVFCIVLGIAATAYAEGTTSFGSIANETAKAAVDICGDAIEESAQPVTDDGAMVVMNIVLSLIIGIVSFVTIVGNLMVFASVMIFRKLQTIPNMFILSLAVADLIMGGFVLPIGAHDVIGHRWLLGHFFCDIWTSVDVLSVTASIGTLCIISLDRYVAITMPFQYSLRMTRPRARCIIGAVWIISAATAFIPIHLGWWKSEKPCDVKCYEDPECCEFRTNPTYGVVSSCISFYIPLIVMVIAYSIVFKIAIQKRSKIRNREGVYRRASMPGTRSMLWGRGEYRAIFTMGIIMGTFVICWLPFFIINVLSVFCDDCVPKDVFLGFNWLGYVNSFFNPIIYSHSKEFRRAFKRILHCGLCRDGYRQTSRASLSVSYTPTASARSSVRESSIFQLTNLLFNGERRRASRMSTSSVKSRRSPVQNGRSPVCSSNNNNGGLRRPSYGYRYSGSDMPKCHFETGSGSSGNSYASESAFLPSVPERSDELKVPLSDHRSSDCDSGCEPEKTKQPSESSDQLIPT
uniref:Beta-2 adrenergic receptor-like n=1 Tax=Phallusia mammillata TaxID=59560 RepID=A0A6F9DSC1_9ASCI|nr:beta-2 adrenergic receptor-like [Phallusia mammillata]